MTVYEKLMLRGIALALECLWLIANLNPDYHTAKNIMKWREDFRSLV